MRFRRFKRRLAYWTRSTWCGWFGHREVERRNKVVAVCGRCNSLYVDGTTGEPILDITLMQQAKNEADLAMLRWKHRVLGGPNA